eukprot:CAMPEP_0202909542 /NCGR_PEP_ID=MMETSP1392-20130828/49625_1 /ASSEMBLY_ACC=CAM_ASM_000868 /TAXON_ID=225041 /ORGANISM="Chlamydomonas chlamydogama, Strain SAG 11-48b" /LENGTH=67 /DNA_ID=CAMNT_0049599335 /DNA_START=43 /DNA_END=243 /DNA_ORIENTATION=-
MADKDEAGPSGSGRGDGGSGRGSAGQKKVKFVPTIPGRRKKNEDAGGLGVTAAEAAAANDEFQDLIK